MTATVVPLEPARAAHPPRRPGPDATRRRPPGRPEPERLARTVALAFLEVEAGCRPFAQLAPLLAPALRYRLEPIVRRGGTAPTVESVVAVRSSCPDPHRCDAAVVVRRGGRVGAVVVSLERRGSGWRIVDLGRPEDHQPAP